MGRPYTVERVTLADGRALTYRRVMSSDEFGRQVSKGPPTDGWCDGWPITNDELERLLPPEV